MGFNGTVARPPVAPHGAIARCFGYGAKKVQRGKVSSFTVNQSRYHVLEGKVEEHHRHNSCKAAIPVSVDQTFCKSIRNHEVDAKACLPSYQEDCAKSFKLCHSQLFLPESLPNS